MSDVLQHQIRMLHHTLAVGDLRTIEVLTIEEVAYLFKVGHGTILRWLREKKLPKQSCFRTLGGHRRFFKVYILALLESGGVTDPMERETMIQSAKVRVAEQLREANARPQLAGAVLH